MMSGDVAEARRAHRGRPAARASSTPTSIRRATAVWLTWMTERGLYQLVAAAADERASSGCSTRSPTSSGTRSTPGPADAVGHAQDPEHPRSSGATRCASRLLARRRAAARRGGELHRGQRRAPGLRGATLALDLLRLLRGQGRPAAGLVRRDHRAAEDAAGGLVAARRRPTRDDLRAALAKIVDVYRPHTR